MSPFMNEAATVHEADDHRLVTPPDSMRDRAAGESRDDNSSPSNQIGRPRTEMRKA